MPGKLRKNNGYIDLCKVNARIKAAWPGNRASPSVIGYARGNKEDKQLDKLTPLEALQCYFTCGQQQLGIAVGSELAGSMTLHALGKLHARLAGETKVVIRAAEPKAIVFYQAALLADPWNHMAANDLGVFLARSGRYEDADFSTAGAWIDGLCRRSAVFYKIFYYLLILVSDLLGQAYR